MKDPTSLEDYLGVQIVQSDDGKKPGWGNQQLLRVWKTFWRERVAKEKMNITPGTRLFVERWMISPRWMRQHNPCTRQ